MGWQLNIHVIASICYFSISSKATMVICSSFFHSPAPIKLYSGCGAGSNFQFCNSKFASRGFSTAPVSRVTRSEARSGKGWSFVGGSKLNLKPTSKRLSVPCKAGAAVYASLWSSSQIANNVFTLGTAAVLPFYTLMVVAPKAEMTKKSMRSCLPYIVLGIVYAYLLYLSWTPGTLQAMFASKYWMPELSAIASLFTNEVSLSSAWIHLLAIDLFAARQVYHEGLANDIETRHSVSLCLLFCPIGLLSHYITKSLTERARR
ncbi:hypothetical protein QQ045_027187 [Rhodiola kirilowii]